MLTAYFALKNLFIYILTLRNITVIEITTFFAKLNFNCKQ